MVFIAYKHYVRPFKQSIPKVKLVKSYQLIVQIIKKFEDLVKLWQILVGISKDKLEVYDTNLVVFQQGVRAFHDFVVVTLGIGFEDVDKINFLLTTEFAERNYGHIGRLNYFSVARVARLEE